MADTERKAQGSLPANDGWGFIQLRGGYRHRVLRSRFLCGEYDLQTCELLRVQCKTDY